MTKVDIVREISNETGVSKVDVLNTVEKFIDVVKGTLVKNQNVTLNGFGTFLIKQKAQKPARNIKKNTTVIIPAHKTVAFKPSKLFVAKVKENVK